MRRIRFVIAGALFSTLAACVPPGPAVQLKFNASDYAAYSKSGTASITGQAFLRQRGGGVVTCAGSTVFLFPNAPAFRNMIETAKHSRIDVQAEGDMRSIGRTAICDAQGNFRFDRLPAQSWIVATQVRWQVGSAGQGGDLLTTINTSNGETTQVFLTDDHRV